MLTDEVNKKIEMLDFYDRRMRLAERPCLTNLFIEVTSRCNAKCEHCGSSCGEKIPKDEIEYEYLAKTLKEIANHYDASKIFIDVTGGEPLLRKDLFDLMKYARSLGYRWGMTSNGMLITKSMAKKIEDAEMSTVSISIDGLKETHESFRKVPGSFDKIIKGIEYLKEIPSIEVLQITTVANKKNMDELEDIYQLLVKLGIKSWRIANCDPIGRAKEHDEILLDSDDFKRLFQFIIEKNNENKMHVTYGCSHYLGVSMEKTVRSSYFFCMAGFIVGSILSNGDIFVCPNVPRKKELIQGNIKKDSFVEVWENKFQDFRQKRVTCNEKCRTCSEWKFCGGDSLHTWNFDDNEPTFCLKDELEEKVDLSFDKNLDYNEKYYRALVKAAHEHHISKDMVTTILAEANQILSKEYF